MPDTDKQFANNGEDNELVGLFNSPKYEKDGVGLALSGGGYKAAAYHLGALIRLHELGLLPKINRISSVSGGSITSGFLGKVWDDLAFDPQTGQSAVFKQRFVDPLREFLTNANIDVPQILLGLLAPFRSGADGVTAAYRKKLFGGATLQDLPTPGPGTPEFVIVATNYELNSLWRFGKRYAADYRVGRIDEPTFTLAEIVAASSGFPPFFCPLDLKFDSQTVKPMKGADRNNGPFLKRALLCDGGIYDNMGLEPVWKRYGTLLVSNAGDIFDEESHPGDWFSLLMRIISMVHRQAENNRQRPLMLLAKLKERTVAYWPLRNANSIYPTPSPLAMSDDDVSEAQEEKVRLWSLGDKAFKRLVNHGYRMCDAATGSYLTLGPNPPAPKLPY